MSEQLVTIIREYIEDNTQPYAVSDDVILRILNQSRNSVYNLQVFPEVIDGNFFVTGYKYLTNVTVTDGTNIVSAENYSLDVFNGTITFNGTAPNSIYVSFTYHDFYNTVAELWKYRAALAKFSGRTRLGDEDIPEDKNSREYCIQKYWYFRTSRTLQSER